MILYLKKTKINGQKLLLLVKEGLKKEIYFVIKIYKCRAGAGVAWSPCSIKEISFSDENCDL